MTEEQELGITIASDAVKISGSITMDIDRAQTEIEKVETTKFSELQKVAVLGGGLQRANLAKNRGVGFTRKRSSKRKRKNGKSV